MDERIVPISDVRPNDWNINTMSPAIYQDLVKEVKEEDIDQRVIVVEAVDKTGQKYFKIIDGEHRYRASLENGKTELPVVVKSWQSEEEMKIKTVRRNLLTGTQSNERLKKLVDEMANGDIALERQLLSEMALEQSRINDILAEEDTDKEPPKVKTKDVNVRTFEDASSVLQELMEEGGALGEGLCIFTYKGKQISILSADTLLNTQMKLLEHAVVQGNFNLAKALRYVISTVVEMYQDGQGVPNTYDPAKHSLGEESSDKSSIY